MRKYNVAVPGLVCWIRALLNEFIRGLLQPDRTAVVLAAVADLSRSQADLIAEHAHALLRQQLAILQRQAKRPHLTPADRFSLVFFAR